MALLISGVKLTNYNTARKVIQILTITFKTYHHQNSKRLILYKLHHYQLQQSSDEQHNASTIII